MSYTDLIATVELSRALVGMLSFLVIVLSWSNISLHIKVGGLRKAIDKKENLIGKEKVDWLAEEYVKYLNSKKPIAPKEGLEIVKEVTETLKRERYRV